MDLASTWPAKLSTHSKFPPIPRSHRSVTALRDRQPVSQSLLHVGTYRYQPFGGHIRNISVDSSDELRRYGACRKPEAPCADSLRARPTARRTPPDHSAGRPRRPESRSVGVRNSVLTGIDETVRLKLNCSAGCKPMCIAALLAGVVACTPNHQAAEGGGTAPGGGATTAATGQPAEQLTAQVAAEKIKATIPEVSLITITETTTPTT